MISPTLTSTATEFSDPMRLVRVWYEGALASNVHDPAVLALATANSQGQASNRIVRILDFRDVGLVFTTHAGSLKGCQLAQTHWASGVMYWPEISQQIIVSGRTGPLPDAESDALWAARSISAHPMSVASKQSEPLHDVDGLREKAAQLRQLNKALPRPSAWMGYQLKPSTVEFWQADPNGLHQRLRYERADFGWRSEQLQP